MRKVTFCELKNLSAETFQQIITQDKNYFPDSWTEQAWRDSASHQDYFMVFVEETNKVVAWALVKMNGLEAMIHLLKILVLPEKRKSGFGLELMDNLKTWARARSLERCYLEVDKSNHSAINFYGRQGFKILHEIKQFYSDGRDALTMQLNY